MTAAAIGLEPVTWKCSWDCHGLPVEHEIDKAFGEMLHQ